MVKGDVIFVATGVTDGEIVNGIKVYNGINACKTHSCLFLNRRLYSSHYLVLFG